MRVQGCRCMPRCVCVCVSHLKRLVLPPHTHVDQQAADSHRLRLDLRQCAAGLGQRAAAGAAAGATRVLHQAVRVERQGLRATGGRVTCDPTCPLRMRVGHDSRDRP